VPARAAHSHSASVGSRPPVLYNPSYFKGDDLPVETVTWTDAKAYCEMFRSEANLLQDLADEHLTELARDDQRVREGR